MESQEANLSIEVSAALLAIEWKDLFGRELKLAAIQVAQGADRLTSEHYRQAAPTALAKVLKTISNSPSDSSSDVKRRVA